MSSKQSRKKLEFKYGPICMLGDKTDSSNILTAHHIIPVRECGNLTLENLALISERTHIIINNLEFLDPYYMKIINQGLLKIKEILFEDKIKCCQRKMKITKKVSKCYIEHNNKIKTINIINFGKIKVLSNTYNQYGNERLKRMLIRCFNNSIITPEIIGLINNMYEYNPNSIQLLIKIIAKQVNNCENRMEISKNYYRIKKLKKTNKTVFEKSTF